MYKKRRQFVLFKDYLVHLQPIPIRNKTIMQKNLVIVESPAKAKTIEKFLGKDYKVLSSYGHIRDLKTKQFSIDIEHNYAPQYEIPADKKKLVSELKAESKAAEMVWFGSHPMRTAKEKPYRGIYMKFWD